MGAREDDEEAYTTYDDIVGRSMRRGIRKGVKAVTLGILGGGNPLKSSLTNLVQDAIEKLPTAIERSRKNKEE